MRYQPGLMDEMSRCVVIHKIVNSEHLARTDTSSTE